jgi:hypothetical protein
MEYRMQMARRDPVTWVEPVGVPLTAGDVIVMLNDPDIGGVTRVEPCIGFGDYTFIITISIRSLDAQGEVLYLANFDPHVAFPQLPVTSRTIYERAVEVHH